GLDRDHGGASLLAGLGESRLELGDRTGGDDVGAQALRVRREVDAQARPRELAVLSTLPVARPEAARSERLRQAADRPEAPVVDEHDHELHVLLEGGDDLLRHHEPRAVAYHREDLAVWRGHLHAEGPRDLVAHAGVAVLEVVAPGVPRGPELVDAAGQAVRRAYDPVPG